jgi:hypothetical protein
MDMNEMQIPELARLRQATLLREAANERLARTLRPEPEPVARTQRVSLARRVLHTLTARLAPHPAH